MQQNQEKERNDSKEIDEQRWQAVCNRDQAWDGIFVFAVCTTGVYCHPSCISRRANREFRFTTHLHRLRLRAIELVNAANPIK